MPNRISLSTIRAHIAGAVITPLFIVLSGCSSTKPGTGYVEDTPDAIETLIRKEYSEAVFAVGTASGTDEGTATRLATMHARAEIVREFKSRIDVLQKNYEESINDKSVAEFTQVMEVFASLEMTGSHIAKSMVRREKSGTFTAKVLVVLTAEHLKNLLDEKMQAYTSFRASGAYKELEERVERERTLREVAQD
jgi:hypothetical protein